MSHAIFPPTGDPVEKPFSANYMSWWEKAHGKFLENNLQALIDDVGLKSTTPLGGEDQGAGKTLPKVKKQPIPIPKAVTQYKKRKLKSSKAALKEVVCTSTDIEKHPPTLPFSTQSSTNDKYNGIVFEEKSIVFNRKKEFILGLWKDICNRLSKTRAELLSSYREKIIEIFEDMKRTNILDLSPLENLLDSLFELAASYDQERSNMVDKTSEDEKIELISKAKERLELFKLEASEKVKKVSSSVKKLKRVVKKLQTLQQGIEKFEGVMKATRKEVEEIQANIPAAETEVSSYDNANLLIVDDSANLEAKKKNLETSCQELINYKFYLD
ncbi:uncharacterized protein [Nicotiana sylvestris]|uniref:uncharacterized protein n=1 Tax=Nicotiana sylvestris TaxID=4096 RepID=UPI00388C7BF8